MTMTREEIIERGEKQLKFATSRLGSGNMIDSQKVAHSALAQLDMLSYILGEDWDGYDKWFEIIYKYL